MNIDFINFNLKEKHKSLIRHASGTVKHRWF